MVNLNFKLVATQSNWWKNKCITNN